MSIKRKIASVIFFMLFLSMIPIASYFLFHVGICAPNQPCIIPVWFAPTIYAPSGVLFAGCAFVLRDILQRLAGLYVSLIAVICGTILSYIYVDPTIAIAGCSAYLVSEMMDTIIYSFLQKYNLLLAILVSAGISLIVDSIIFLHIAFHSYQLLLGQIIGKSWMILISIPLIKLGRKTLASKPS